MRGAGWQARALVLAAVIVLPMVLDSQPVPVADNIPIKVPERNTPFQPQVSEPQVAPPVASAQGAGQAPAAAPADPTGTIPTPPPVVSVPPPVMTAQPQCRPPAPRRRRRPRRSRPAGPQACRQARSQARSQARRQAGNAHRRRRPRAGVARGPQRACRHAARRKPAATKGNFRQVAAYTTSDDAQSRRSKLHQAGVTNAFVEQANIGGKQQYRLRVGPFPSREAAAAQARLRTLGYDNGFIAAQ